MIIWSMLVAVEQRKLASVNPAAEMVNSVRVEMMRPSVPDSGIMITSAIRYAVCTQEISSEPAERPAWIWFSDDDTTCMSRIAMNMPNTITTKAKTVRGGT